MLAGTVFEINLSNRDNKVSILTLKSLKSINSLYVFWISFLLILNNPLIAGSRDDYLLKSLDEWPDTKHNIIYLHPISSIFYKFAMNYITYEREISEYVSAIVNPAIWFLRGDAQDSIDYLLCYGAKAGIRKYSQKNHIMFIQADIGYFHIALEPDDERISYFSIGPMLGFRKKFKRISFFLDVGYHFSLNQIFPEEETENEDTHIAFAIPFLIMGEIFKQVLIQMLPFSGIETNFGIGYNF